MKNDQMKRQDQWTKSIAVGDKPFLEAVKAGLNGRALKRNIVGAEIGAYQLRETPPAPYGGHFSLTSSDNEYTWG